MENTNPKKLDSESFRFDEILFAIVLSGNEGYKVIMSGQHGEQQLMENIAAHFALVAMQHHPFEQTLRAVVHALDEERDALQKELDRLEITKECTIG